MSEEREMLIEGARSDSFLEALQACSMRNRDERQDLASLVAELHNEGLINAVSVFCDLRARSDQGVDFFTIRDVFQHALPHLSAPVKDVMACVLKLRADAGQDLASDFILQGYVEYLYRDVMRAIEALNIIESDSFQLVDLLAPTIEAGFRNDSRRFLSEAVRLCLHPDLELRRRAVFALGIVKWQEGANISEEALTVVERIALEESDDQILAVGLKSAFAFYRHNRAHELRMTKVITGALLKGGDLTLHALSEVFAFYTGDLTESLLDLAAAYLVRINPTNKGTIDNADLGIAELLKGSSYERGLAILENLLLVNHHAIKIESLDSCARRLMERRELLAKIITRWFLRGDHVLCEAIRSIAKAHHKTNLRLEVDHTELAGGDSSQRLTLGRRAVGYLFFQPVTAASVLIGVMKSTANEELCNGLCELLFDPILMNYSGEVYDYVREQQHLDGGVLKDVLTGVVKRADDYLNDLNSVGALPALHPSEAQREAQLRHFSGQMDQAFKEAQARSVLLSLFSRTVLLYGRKSIDYVGSDELNPRRTETPLHRHGTSIEVPRMQTIDPFGLEFLLRMLRVATSAS